MSYEDLPLFEEPDDKRKPQVQIICDDVLAWTEKYDGPPFHGLLTDCPYHLSGGFMGKAWDRDGPEAISFRPDTWKVLAQHLLPGAFGMCFASSRGFHRLMVAIEDAGLIIHPAIFNYRSGEVIEVQELYGFCYGSGFPKASRIDTQVDKAAGAEREVFVNPRWAGKYPNGPGGGEPSPMVRQATRKSDGPLTDTAPATPLAQAWAGHRYGLQALKPALEPIIVFQKPYQGKPVQSITQTGAGALNIDGGRIDTGSPPVRDNSHMSSKGYPGGKYGNTAAHGHYEKIGLGTEVNGRWPANFALCHTHLPDEPCETELCPVAALDAQAGERKSPQTYTRSVFVHGGYNNGARHGERQAGDLCYNYGDTGGPSRFFHVSDWSIDVAEQLTQSDPVFYTAKASRSERDAGLSHDPQSRQSALGEYKVRQCNVCSSRHKDSGPATRHLACGHSDWSWVEMTQAGSRGGAARNPHPTVKPLKLCQWLATLLLPPDAYAPRRLLVPFCGTASEGIGAILAGWDEIVMVDSNQEYCNIARARISYWEQHRDAKHR